MYKSFPLFVISYFLIASFIYTPAFASYSNSWEYTGWNTDGKEAQISAGISRLSTTAETDIIIPLLFNQTLSQISPNYGAARPGGRIHEGEDLIAPRNTPIISPTDAVVANIGYGASSGYFVSTVNPGGETFIYMHLDEIANGITSGTYVTKGTVLGLVGDTGDAKGTPHLHFEIRKNGSTDPYPRIKKELSESERAEYVNRFVSEDRSKQNENDILKSFNISLANAQSTIIDNLVTGAGNYENNSVNTFSQNTPSPVSKTLASTITGTLNTGGNTMVTTKLNIAINLFTGARSEDVKKLQVYLIAKNAGVSAQKLSANGATGFYGALTAAAVKEFQISVGITPATGTVGPKTRAYISSN